MQLVSLFTRIFKTDRQSGNQNRTPGEAGNAGFAALLAGLGDTCTSVNASENDNTPAFVPVDGEVDIPAALEPEKSSEPVPAPVEFEAQAIEAETPSPVLHGPYVAPVVEELVVVDLPELLPAPESGSVKTEEAGTPIPAQKEGSNEIPGQINLAAGGNKFQASGLLPEPTDHTIPSESSRGEATHRLNKERVTGDQPDERRSVTLVENDTHHKTDPPSGTTRIVQAEHQVAPALHDELVESSEKPVRTETRMGRGNRTEPASGTTPPHPASNRSATEVVPSPSRNEIIHTYESPADGKRQVDTAKGFQTTTHAEAGTPRQDQTPRAAVTPEGPFFGPSGRISTRSTEAGRPTARISNTGFASPAPPLKTTKEPAVQTSGALSPEPAEKMPLPDRVNTGSTVTQPDEAAPLLDIVETPESSSDEKLQVLHRMESHGLQKGRTITPGPSEIPFDAHGKPSSVEAEATTPDLSGQIRTENDLETTEKTGQQTTSPVIKTDEPVRSEKGGQRETASLQRAEVKAQPVTSEKADTGTNNGFGGKPQGYLFDSEQSDPSIDSAFTLEAKEEESRGISESGPNTASSTTSRANEASRPAAMLQRGQAMGEWVRSLLQKNGGQVSTRNGWNVLEMKLEGDNGSVTIRTRREDDRMSVAVGFTDPQLRAVAQANLVELKEVLQAHYASNVDFSLSGDGSGGQDPREHAPGSGPAGRSHESNGRAEARKARSAHPGSSREWIG